MPPYPALHATLPRRTEDPNALRTGYAIGGGIAQRQEKTRLAGLRGEALAGMTGGGGQPDYFSGEGPSPEAGGMGFGAFQQPQGAPGPLGQPQGARAEKRALYKYLAEDPKGAAEMYGAISKMEDREREQGERQMGELGQLLNWVQGAATPLERESRYQQALQTARGRGLDVGGASPNYDPDEVGAQVAVVTKLSEQFKRAAAAKKAAAEENRFKRTEAGKDRRQPLEKVYDPDSPSLSRLTPRSEAAGKPGAVSKGITVTMDENGKPVVTIGGTPGMEKKTRGSVEQKLLDTTEGLSRMAEIAAAFKPEYQTIATRWNTWLSAMKEKAGFEVSAEDTQTLYDFAEHKRSAFSAMNAYIKSVTGAQMTESEAKRIMKGIPNPGSGLFDGDSPTEFKSKLRGTVSSMRRAAARYNYALRKGLDWKKITLDQITDIMSQRQAEIIEELKARGMTDEAMEPVLEQRLGEEFGLKFGGA